MKKEDQNTLISEQERMVDVLKNNRIVSKIVFQNFDKNNETGFFSADAIVDDKYLVRFSLNGQHGEITLNELLSYSSGEQLQKGKTETAVEVTYYLGENNE